jgi:hypothetical protein
MRARPSASPKCWAAGSSGSSTPAQHRCRSARDWKYVRQYADAKNEIVAEIMTRAHTG